MNIVICGSRSINKVEIFNAAINVSKFFDREYLSDSELKNVTIIHGNELGVDQLTVQFATHNNVQLKHMQANWTEYGKSAANRRNQEMVNYAMPNGALLAIWDGYSHGTLDCIVRAHKAELMVYVYMPDVFTCAQIEADRISKKFQKR